MGTPAKNLKLVYNGKVNPDENIYDDACLFVFYSWLYQVLDDNFTVSAFYIKPGSAVFAVEN
jgi:hypothetical protein